MTQRNAPQISAFTSKANGLLNVLQTEVSVFQPIPNQKHKVEKFTAIWDTGATSSVITPKVVERLGLIPSGKTHLHGVAGSKENANTYFLSFILPNRVRVNGVRVAEVPKITGNTDVLIGMDIITLEDFAITNVGGKTVFSFITPSIKMIDYVEGINKSMSSKSLERSPSKKVGRNDPCPCGSEKKYKHCHGK